MASPRVEVLRSRHRMSAEYLSTSLIQQLAFLHSCTGPHVLESQTEDGVEMCGELVRMLLNKCISTYSQIAPNETFALPASVKCVAPSRDGDSSLPTYVAIGSSQLRPAGDAPRPQDALFKMIAVLNEPEQSAGGRYDLQLELPGGAWRTSFIDAMCRYEDLIEEVASLGKIRGAVSDPFSSQRDLNLVEHIRQIGGPESTESVRLGAEAPTDLWMSSVAMLGIADFVRQWAARRRRPAYRLEGIRYLLRAHQNDRREDVETVVQGRFSRSGETAAVPSKNRNVPS